MFKLMILPKTVPGLSRSGLREHLEHVHAPLCLGLPSVGGHFRRYVHHYAQDGPEVDPLLGKPVGRWDALTTICFDNAAAFQASVSSPEYETLVLPDENGFRDAQGSIGMPVDERILLDGRAQEIVVFHLRRRVPGLSRDDAGRAWRDRLASILVGHQGGLGNYVQNIVQGPDGSAFDFIDELSGWTDRASSVFQDIIHAERGLFEPKATQAIVALRKVFI